MPVSARIDVDGTAVTVPAREVTVSGLENTHPVVRNFVGTADFTVIELPGDSVGRLFVRGDAASRADTLRRVAATLNAAAHEVEAGLALNTDWEGL